MITYPEALHIIRDQTPATRIVLRPMRDALGLVLATDVQAAEAIPLFASSAMDGYALRSEDLLGADTSSPVQLDVDGIAQPGDPPTTRVRASTAVRILTGAMIPDGADAVIMQEDVHANGKTVQCLRHVEVGSNIRPRGEEYREGDMVFPRGTLITPAVSGMLSTLGYARVHVFARPSVALVVTGNELCDPSEKLRPGQIRDANTYSLQAALRGMGFEPTVVRVKDDADGLHQTVQILMRRHDCVITSGGVSVGDYDHVRGTMKRLRVQEQFWRIAIKPGKPVYFGTRGMHMVFGLPGNPVSALLALYLFVRPALAICSGAPVPRPWWQRVRLGCDIAKKRGRDEFMRMRLVGESDEEQVALPVRGQGSHMLGGLAAADAILQCPAEADFIAKGTLVDVERIRWSMI